MADQDGRWNLFDDRVCDDQGQELVECDQNCGALEDPVTLDQFRATLTHYKRHRYLGGCAHGR